MIKMGLKDNWNQTDEHCHYCDAITNPARGLCKQNLKRLVFSKPTSQDWIMLFIIFMVLLLAWRYNVETQMARDTLANLDLVCLDYLDVPTQTSAGNLENDLPTPSDLKLQDAKT